MFSRVATTFFYTSVTFALLAAATPNPDMMKRWGSPTTTPGVTKTVTVTAPGSTSTSAGNCNTGPIQCCQSTQSSSSPGAAALLGLLGVVLEGVDVLVGLNCSPISVIGVGSGGACNASPVCCENNSFGSLISIGCIPVTL